MVVGPVAYEKNKKYSKKVLRGPGIADKQKAVLSRGLDKMVVCMVGRLRHQWDLTI